LTSLVCASLVRSNAVNCFHRQIVKLAQFRIDNHTDYLLRAVTQDGHPA